MGSIRTQDGAELQLLPGPLEQLRAGFRGSVLTPESEGYDAARSVWNGMIDRHPALILQCAASSDVEAAVRFVGQHQLSFSVRSGGHHIAGNAVCEGGVQIDLSAMRQVRVDANARRAYVQPGCMLADVDAATQQHGLATPLGINSTTGVAGLTLGGGFGWLTRRCGMTVDNVRSVELVTATGALVRASHAENADLFWAVRGGGGNFGIVTEFEYALHPVGPMVLSGLIVHPFEDAALLLRYYREYSATLPEEATVWVVLRKAPPLPFLPREWHGREVVVLAACYSGADHATGERLFAPLRAFGRPIADVIGPHPYAGWQQAFDPLLVAGARNYWKSHDFTALPDALLDTMVASAGQLPGPECEIFIAQLAGAAGRVPSSAMAYGNRNVQYVMNVHARWQQPAQDLACITWARDVFQRVAPYATGSAYTNFMTAEETERVAAAYGANYARLAEVKGRWDPANLFRTNINIAPALQAQPSAR